MSNDKNLSVVIAVFETEGDANNAISALRSWDKANDEIKLGVIGAIFKDGEKIKARSGRQMGKGAAIGAVVGVMAAVLTGGATLVGGAISYGAAGGIAGAFFRKSLHLTQEQIQRIGADLDGGRVAVIVTCDGNEIEPISEQLRSAGGKVRAYAVPTEAIEETVAAIKAAPETMEAIGVETVQSVDRVGHSE